MTATAQIEIHAAQTNRQWLGDRFITLLGILLLGYGTLGRSFAYVGVSPVFIGEVTLLLGIAVVAATCRRLPILLTPLALILLLFDGWGLARALPFIGKYKVDALRDSAVWGYSAYAFIVSSLIAQDPRRFARLLAMYRKFIGFFLWCAPISCITARLGPGLVPTLPWAPDVQIIQLKGGDLLVHLTGVFCFIAVLGCDLQPWMPLVLVPLLLVLNLQGRAGMVTFLVGFLLVTILKPHSRFLLRIWMILLTLIALLWITDIHIRFDSDGPRDLSFDQLSSGIVSIFGESKRDALDGSKEWRLKWWQAIENYTFDGPYFWTGKGYGINLAEDDGFQVEEDNSLRNPHNAHMTFLARGGVPGLAFWITAQAGFAIAIGFAYFRARIAKRMDWANVFLFLLVYWAAFIANASFDVFLEGPMGGIWFWSVYGTGMGAMYVFRCAPEVLDKPPAIFEDSPQVRQPKPGTFVAKNVRGTLRSTPN